VPIILKTAIKIDWPLNPLPLLKNITRNSIDIKRFCPNAEYTPLWSPSIIVPNSIMLNAENINKPNEVYAFNDDIFGNSFLWYLKNWNTITESNPNQR
jgi:hypothetical protein